MKFQNNKNAELKFKNSIPYLTFPDLSRIGFIRHGFSTRLGGVSQGYFESMNLGYNRGDDKKSVDENYRRICNALGFSMEDLVASDQVHNTDIKLVTNADKGKGIIKDRDYQGVDGLITNIPGIPLVTYYADCVPLYLVDTRLHVIGLSHSGWRGTVKKMGEKTLHAMKEQFGTNTEDVVSLIGPSICGDCYEVSEDVAQEFGQVFLKKELDKILYKKDNHKYQLNLWQANYYIFLKAGLKPENIHISGVCTCCNSDLLFSHRATQGKRGTLAAFLMLEK